MKLNLLDQHKITLKISMMGVLISIVILLWNVFAIDTEILKISVSFVPKMLMGAMFGPLWSGIGEIIADIIGNVLFAKNSFFIGFTLNKFLEGVLYGYFFFKKDICLRNTIICTILITIIINLGLTPLWLWIMYGIPLNSLVIWMPRLVKEIVYVLFQVVLINQILKRTEIRKIIRLIK